MEKGNKLFTEVFNIQKLHTESVVSQRLKKPISPISPENITQSFNGTIEQLLRKHQIKSPVIYDQMKLEALNNLIPKEKAFIYNQYLLEPDKFTPQELTEQKINNLFSSIYHPIIKEINNSWLKINSEHNLLPSVNIENQSNIENKVTLTNFINTIQKCEDKMQNYVFMIPRHACAINIKKKNKDIIYTFFDPNTGVYTYNKFNQFSAFLNKYMKTLKGFNFRKGENSDYTIELIKLNRIIPDLEPNKTNEKLENHLQVNELLTLDGYKTSFKKKTYWGSIPKQIDSSIVYRHFDKKKQLVTLTFSYADSDKHKHKTLYTSNIDAINLYQVIQNNLKSLKQTDENIFIDKQGNIYPIASNINMAEFNIDSDIETMFGPSTLNKKSAWTDIMV